MVNLGYPVNFVQIASFQRHKTSVIPWESIKMLPKGDLMLKRVSPHSIISCRLGWQHRWCSSWLEGWGGITGGSTITNRHFFLKCLSTLCDAADHHPNDFYHLSTDKVTQHMKVRCTISSQVRVTLQAGEGDQLPTPHTWTGSLIANMFQNGLEEWITESVAIAPREVILFFGWKLLKEGLDDARDVGFHFGSPVNRARREAQVETVVSAVQVGHWAIKDAIMKKRTKARGPGHIHGTMKTNWTPTAAYNIKGWMQGLEEDASKAEVRNGKVSNHGTEQRNPHSQHAGRRQGVHNCWVTLLVDLLLQREGVLNDKANGVPIN